MLLAEESVDIGADMEFLADFGTEASNGENPVQTDDETREALLPSLGLGVPVLQSLSDFSRETGRPRSGKAEGDLSEENDECCARAMLQRMV